MAKVVGPLHSSEARGRIGGLIYNTFRGMATVKAKHAPCQPRTALQLAARSIAVGLARIWADCVGQAAWNAYAATHPYLDGMGLTIRATGLNWFVGLNSRLAFIGISPVATPPIVAAPQPVTELVLTPSAGQIVIAWTTPDDADHKVEHWVDGPHSAGRQGSLPRARVKGRTTATGKTATLAGLQPGNYTLWERSLSVDDGQVSTWITASCVVT